MSIFEREIQEWMNEVHEMEKINEVIANQLSDSQRKKITYYITKEVLVQSGNIYDLALEVNRDMKTLLEFIGEENRDIQYHKKKIKR